MEKIDSVDCTAAASFCSTAFNEPFGGEYTLRRSALVVAFYRLPILTHRPQTRITMIELVLGNQCILLVYMAVNMLSQYSKGASNIAVCYPIVACVVHCTLRPCTHRPLTSCRNIRDFLSDKKTQQLLGVDPPARGNFTYQSSIVNQAFRQNIDHWGFPAQDYISALLERGIRVLIYVGATDYICNWVRSSHVCEYLHSC